MRKTFKNWVLKTESLKEGTDLGMITSPDDDLVANQLNQMVDRVAGLLHNAASDGAKKDLLERFIADLQARINEDI